MRRHQFVLPLIAYMATSGLSIAQGELPSVEELLTLNEQARARIHNCSYQYRMTLAHFDEQTGAKKDDRTWEGTNTSSGQFLRSEYLARTVKPGSLLHQQRQGVLVRGENQFSFYEQESNDLNPPGTTLKQAVRYDHAAFTTRSNNSLGQEEVRTGDVLKEAFGFSGKPIREFLDSPGISNLQREVEQVAGPGGTPLFRITLSDPSHCSATLYTFDFSPAQSYLLCFMQSRDCQGHPILTYSLQHSEVEPTFWFPSTISQVHELKGEDGQWRLFTDLEVTCSNVELGVDTSPGQFQVEALGIPEGTSMAWWTEEGKLTSLGMTISNGHAVPTHELSGVPIEYANTMEVVQ